MWLGMWLARVSLFPRVHDPWIGVNAARRREYHLLQAGIRGVREVRKHKVERAIANLARGGGEKRDEMFCGCPCQFGRTAPRCWEEGRRSVSEHQFEQVTDLEPRARSPSSSMTS